MLLRFALVFMFRDVVVACFWCFRGVSIHFRGFWYVSRCFRWRFGCFPRCVVWCFRGVLFCVFRGIFVFVFGVVVGVFVLVCACGAFSVAFLVFSRRFHFPVCFQCFVFLWCVFEAISLVFSTVFLGVRVVFVFPSGFLLKLEEHGSAFWRRFGPSPNFGASPRHVAPLQKNENQSICSNILQKKRALQNDPKCIFVGTKFPLHSGDFGLHSEYTPITLTLFDFIRINFHKLHLHLHFSFLN